MIVIYTALITLCNSFSLLVATHPSHTERRINSTYNMDDVTHHHGDRRRLQWTPKMCVDLLHCRDMARQLHSSEDCPRKVNGRRQGVMELTKRFWDEKGYQNLERTAQNLRDKIGHIEKSSQTAAVLIDNEIDEQRLQLINAEEQSEQHTVMSNNNEAQPNINTERTSIIPRLLHDSTGLPYVKDRLLTRATKSLDRIAQNPLVEASISSHRHNPGWDRFPTPLSVVRPGDS